MEYEFDPAKSNSNKNKHGIDFSKLRQYGMMLILSKFH